MITYAYVNHGRWIADCPTGCNNAENLICNQTLFHCSECYAVADVTWPEGNVEIFTILGIRPNESNRNWFPKNHPIAIACNLPHGQSIMDLIEETVKHLGEDTFTIIQAALNEVRCN